MKNILETVDIKPFFLYERHNLGNDKFFIIFIPDTKLFMTCFINRYNSSQSQKEYFKFFITRPANDRLSSFAKSPHKNCDFQIRGYKILT